MLKNNFYLLFSYLNKVNTLTFLSSLKRGHLTY